MIVVKWYGGGYWIAYLDARFSFLPGGRTADEALQDAWLLWGGDLPAIIYPRVA